MFADTELAPGPALTATSSWCPKAGDRESQGCVTRGAPVPGLLGWAGTQRGAELSIPSWLWQPEQAMGALHLRVPALRVAVARGHCPRHPVCVSILGSSTESRSAATWGPICPFPSDLMSQRGTQCWTLVSPKATRPLPLHPTGVPGGPHSSQLPMGRQTHLNR